MGRGGGRGRVERWKRRVEEPGGMGGGIRVRGVEGEERMGRWRAMMEGSMGGGRWVAKYKLNH